MHSDPLSATFAALADPTRRAILARLAKGEATVGELAAPFELSLPAISKHLKVLQRAGLIEQGRQAQWRPCRLKPDGLRDVAEWVEQYRRHFEERFDRLDAYLREIQTNPDPSDAGNPAATPGPRRFARSRRQPRPDEANVEQEAHDDHAAS
jgi:DNA-binding transcriptional ArsR family regulator